MPAIVALIKYVPDTWSVKRLGADRTLDRDAVSCELDEINEYSLEQAQRLRDARGEGDWRVVALSMGPQPAEEALRRALALGADDAIRVGGEEFAGSDILGTAWALHRAIETIPDVRVIIAGQASTDGAAGAVPGILAEYRRIPALTRVREVRWEGKALRATRVDREGEHRLEAAVPAVVTVTDQADKPRFADFKNLMAAKRASIPVLGAADIGVDPAQVGQAHAATAVTAFEPRPERAGCTPKPAGPEGREGAAAILAALESRHLI